MQAYEVTFTVRYFGQAAIVTEDNVLTVFAMSSSAARRTVENLAGAIAPGFTYEVDEIRKYTKEELEDLL